MVNENSMTYLNFIDFKYLIYHCVQYFLKINNLEKIVTWAVITV